MTDKSYSQLNTGLSLREGELLTPSQFDSLLHSQTVSERLHILRGTAYELEQDCLEDVDKLENLLMKHLLASYTWAQDQAPEPAVLELFSLQYTYHNLKVLLKERATKQQLDWLYLPIGSYSIQTLEHLVATLTSEQLPPLMVEEVGSTWQEYLDYGDIRVLEIGMDLAYFKHLRYVGEQVSHPVLKELVRLRIDSYNLMTVLRAKAQGKPHSFLYQLLSDQGSIPSKELLEMVEQGRLSSWFSAVNSQDFDGDLAAFEDKLARQEVRLEEMEALADLLVFKHLDQARYETDGPLPLARFLFGKELEIKNLRLLLTGLNYHLPYQTLKERMRPIYGQ